MRLSSLLAVCLLALAAACSSASPTMPSDVSVPNQNTQGGTGGGNG